MSAEATLLEELLAFALEVAPEVAREMKPVIVAFKQTRPDLASPPVADGEMQLNAEIDAQVAQREAK